MFDKEVLLKEVEFKAVLSGGPGGQHANKTSTKVELSWNLEETTVFSEEKKALLLKNLQNRLTKDDVLRLSSDETRSQYQNKNSVIEKFVALIEQSLKVRKRRKKTKPSKMSKLKRLNNKKKHSEKKARRKSPENPTS